MRGKHVVFGKKKRQHASQPRDCCSCDFGAAALSRLTCTAWQGIAMVDGSGLLRPAWHRRPATRCLHAFSFAPCLGRETRAQRCSCAPHADTPHHCSIRQPASGQDCTSAGARWEAAKWSMRSTLLWYWTQPQARPPPCPPASGRQFSSAPRVWAARCSLSVHRRCFAHLHKPHCPRLRHCVRPLV